MNDQTDLKINVPSGVQTVTINFVTEAPVVEAKGIVQVPTGTRVEKTPPRKSGRRRRPIGKAKRWNSTEKSLLVVRALEGRSLKDCAVEFSNSFQDIHLSIQAPASMLHNIVVGSNHRESAETRRFCEKLCDFHGHARGSEFWKELYTRFRATVGDYSLRFQPTLSN